MISDRGNRLLPKEDSEMKIAERLKAKGCGLVDLLHRQEIVTQKRLREAIAETEGKRVQSG